MDPKLFQAATTGNFILFEQAISAHHPTELNQYLLAQTTDTKYNILHIAADNNKEAFILQVIHHIEDKLQLLPHKILSLLCQQSTYSCNPLHIAASQGHLEIVKIFIEAYHKFSKLAQNASQEARVVVENSAKVEDKQMVPPWEARAQNGVTPLIMALAARHEEVAAYVLAQDLEVQCNIVDYNGKSPLYLAVENGLEKIAMQILASNCSYSLGRTYNNQSMLHNASGITEQVAILLLEKHPEFLKAIDSRGETFLHEWAFRGELQSLQCLIKTRVFTKWSKDYQNLLRHRNNFGENPLHRIVITNQMEVLKLLVETYSQLITQNEAGQHDSPWLDQNYSGQTPLHLAIERGKEDIAHYLISLDSRSSCIPTFSGMSPLYLALETGNANIAEQLIYACPYPRPPVFLSGPNGRNPFHVASKCPGIAGILAQLLGIDLMDMKDDDGKAPLDYAARVGDIDLMTMAFNHSGISSSPYAWVEACIGGHMDALRKFIDQCDFRQICIEQRDTPLHHMQLKTKEEYQELLDIPLIGQLKNALDSDGATPLHRAIERKDIVFVELLLTTHGIDWIIKNKKGQTAMDLLAMLCDALPDWDSMCKRIGMNPRIKTTYIPLKTNLAEIRTTLSVVAALLATITFAAGFTIPGGFNDDGYVILAKKAAFIVFLLSDTYAMCCSMLVLFCLIWAMVCDPDRSLVLIDGSVFLLQQSLYGTLVAFMTGVYTVVSHNCLWTAIVVCVMCSLVAIAANKSVLYKLINRFVPSSR